MLHPSWNGLVIPLIDSPRDPQHRPWATGSLIALNVAVGLLTLPLAWVTWTAGHPGYERLATLIPTEMSDVTGLIWVFYTFGFRPAEPGLLTSVSSMFIHAGWLHLAGNMLYLWIYGPNVERRLGRLPFVLLYLTAGLLGTLLYALMSLGNTTPVVGASGAISGVLGAYLVFFPANRIQMLVYVTTLRLPAWLVLAAFVVVDNLLPWVSGAPGGVAYTAHLGGFFAGMVLAIALQVLRRASPTPRASPLARALALANQGMVLDAHRVLTTVAETGSAAHARSARDHLRALEADPRYQRATRHQ